MKAFLVSNEIAGQWIGIIGPDGDLTSARAEWGSRMEYRELTWQELATLTKAGGLPVFLEGHEDKDSSPMVGD